MQQTGSQTTNEREEEEERERVDLSGKGSGQCSGYTVQEKKLLAQAHLTLQHTSPRSKHPYVVSDSDTHTHTNAHTKSASER